MRSRVELFARIRRDHRVEGLSTRALARRHRVGRKTVRLALANAAPPAPKARVRSAPRLDPFKDAIDGMLRSDLDAPRKQRHTARRIFDRLADEHGAQTLSYSTVRNYVRNRRAQIEAEAGRPLEAFVPQEHAAGAHAEVDFGEVWVILRGVRTKCHLFVFWLSHSGKAIHRVYPTQAQEAFLQGHIEAFEALGGVPAVHIRYDNLSSAVSAVLKGRGREESDRWIVFRSHYGFDAFYCRPGIAGAHEKGGVEGEVGWFRRNRLTPMPQVDSLDELNENIKGWEAVDERRRINGRIRTIGQDFAAEQPLLAPLPNEAFDPGLVLTPRVDRSALITVRMAKYSVPARLIGRRVRVSLRASELIIFDGSHEVARHPRVVAKMGSSVVLDHYLEVLKIKPGALPGSTALARARNSGVFTPAHEAFWANARKVNGDADGTRELIDVLLLHRALPGDAVIAGINAAVSVGAVSADVVAVEARRHASNTSGQVSAADDGAALKPNRVISLTQRRLTDPAAVIGGLPPDTRPVPSVAAYDQLIPRPARASTN